MKEIRIVRHVFRGDGYLNPGPLKVAVTDIKVRGHSQMSFRKIGPKLQGFVHGGIARLATVWCVIQEIVAEVVVGLCEQSITQCKFRILLGSLFQ
jgi:hypothetical protein